MATHAYVVIKKSQTDTVMAFLKKGNVHMGNVIFGEDNVRMAPEKHKFSHPNTPFNAESPYAFTPPWSGQCFHPGVVYGSHGHMYGH